MKKIQMNSNNAPVTEKIKEIYEVLKLSKL